MNHLDNIIDVLITEGKVGFYENEPEIIQVSKKVFLMKTYFEKDDMLVSTECWVARNDRPYDNRARMGDCKLSQQISAKLNLLCAEWSSKQNTENANNFAKQICDDLKLEIEELQND